MPSKAWMQQRQQVTAWLKPQTYERLRDACAKENKSLAYVIEQGIEAMLGPSQQPQEPVPGVQANGAGK